MYIKVGTPAEVALIRMTADGRLPANERRGYKNVFNALYRITTEESLVTLWKVVFFKRLIFSIFGKSIQFDFYPLRVRYPLVFIESF